MPITITCGRSSKGISVTILHEILAGPPGVAVRRCSFRAAVCLSQSAACDAVDWLVSMGRSRRWRRPLQPPPPWLQVPPCKVRHGACREKKRPGAHRLRPPRPPKPAFPWAKSQSPRARTHGAAGFVHGRWSVLLGLVREGRAWRPRRRPFLSGCQASDRYGDAPWRARAQRTCSRTSAEGCPARASSAAITSGEEGALPRATAMLRSHRS